MPTISKYALIFKNKLLSFEQDLEMMDIICRAQKNDDLLVEDKLLFKYLSPSVHKAIASRNNTKTSKNIVINHLRRTVYVSYVKDLYEELSLYLKSVVGTAALKAKEKEAACRLLGEQKISIDILEPHNPDFKDNLGKAKGFAKYAEENLGIGRIQLIRMGKDAAGKNRFKRLDMSLGSVRNKVLHAQNNDELDHIFDTDGFFM